MTRLLSRDTPARRFSDEHELLISRAIGLARVICILGIVYVHAWTGVGGDVISARAGSAEAMLRWTVIELFGRSAVPLLSVISGWLVAASLEKRGPRGFIVGKAWALLVPMLLWNAIGILLVSGAGLLGRPNVPMPDGPLWWADNMLNLTRSGDISVQTAFLRDLFLCTLAAPLLVRLPTRALLLVMLAGVVWIVGGWKLFLVLRPGILVFFALGIVVRRHGLADRCGTIAPWKVLLLFLAILPFKIALSIRLDSQAGDPAMLLSGVDLLMRASAALLVWRGAIALGRRRAGRRLLALERYAFVLFSSHLIFMWLLAPVIGVPFGTEGSPAWSLFFLAQPFLALAFAIIIARVMEAVSPKLASLLSGGRLG